MQDFLYRAKRPILKRWAEECADAFDWFIAAKEDLFIGDTTLADIPDEHKDLFLVPHRWPLPETYDWHREYYPIFPVTMYFPKGQAAMLPYHLQKGIDTGNLEANFGWFAIKLLRKTISESSGLTKMWKAIRPTLVTASRWAGGLAPRFKAPRTTLR